jgi:hypothetical protein
MKEVRVLVLVSALWVDKNDLKLGWLVIQYAFRHRGIDQCGAPDSRKEAERSTLGYHICLTISSNCLVQRFLLIVANLYWGPQVIIICTWDDLWM